MHPRCTRLARAALGLILAACGPALAAAAPYRIDPDHSAITFEASHLGFSAFHGRFRSFAAQIDFDPQDIEATRVRVVVDAASLYTGSEERDRNTMDFPEMLDVTAFPSITFVSTSVVLTSAETAEMTGDLTLRDVTRPITLRVRLNAHGITPISGGKEVYGFSATGDVDRTAFGFDFAAPAVSAVIPVRIDLEISPVD
ncbi:YceI family protein [Paroceanicella profunda]|uniref:YceI family protein n=1 Tax=Paroceanicella profunda TaxID=2579971 RepID=A0A5B8FX78_9RHOB|nr:YceI family protein [Paroceanicella profunda]QDL92194.1 YceI family protein [Paroceanicella profunda]